MATERLTGRPAILPRVLAGRLWGDRDFFLLDVGASGGLEKHWAQFGDRLRAVGFEPLVAEAERLQRTAGDRVRYEAAFVTCRDLDALFPPSLRADPVRAASNDPFPRVSAVRAQALMEMNYVEQVFNTGAPAVYAERRVVLDDFVPEAEQPFVDFIKVDTDGHDFPVLLGADGLMRKGGALGLSIEVQFHGASHDHANTFANIDRFLRARGFSLFDLEAYRYSRAALPAPFAHDIPAQTVSGQVLWGEAVYFRDLADPDYERKWPYAITPERVLKLACLFDLFGLPDCAAELLLVRRDAAGSAAPALLDDLAAAAYGEPIAYAEAIRRFEADPQALYPGRMAAAAAAGAAVPAAPEQRPPARVGQDARDRREVEDLRRRVARLEQRLAGLREKVRERDGRIERLKGAR